MRDNCFREAVEAGITTVMIAPGSANPIGGQCCIVKTVGKIVDDACIKESAGLKWLSAKTQKESTANRKNSRQPEWHRRSNQRMAHESTNYLKRKKTKEFKDREIKLEALLP
jgi:hypothetical protein